MKYDCFIFYNELDVLEIRLNELDDVVDEFVLVEGKKTFQGDDKKLHFEENKDRFEDFLHKINHVVVDEYPHGIFQKSPWEVEYFTRDSIMDGLEGCSNDDIILISDVDEIPRPEVVASLEPESSIQVLETRFSYYFLNCVRADDSLRWTGPIVLSYANLEHRAPTELRGPLASTELTSQFGLPRSIVREVWALAMTLYIRCRVEVVPNAGWHFSYQGGVESIIDKIESFSATQFNKKEYKDEERIRSAMREGQDLYGRGHDFEFVEVDETFPTHIRDNEEKYQHMILEK